MARKSLISRFKLPQNKLFKRAVLLSIFGLGFFILLVNGIKSLSINSTLKRQQTYARAEASNITAFFQVVGRSLLILSGSSSISYRDSRTLSDMDNYVDKWRETGIINGVILTDHNGIVQFNSNVKGEPDIGGSLADREFFAWAKDQRPDTNNYYISKPLVSKLGASKGQVIVGVAAPVFDSNTFSGVMVSAVQLEPLTRRLLGLLKLSNNAHVYVINEDGDILYDGINSDLVGSSAIDPSSSPFLSTKALGEKILDDVHKRNEGTMVTDEQMIAYSPINLGGNDWLLLVATPLQKTIAEAVSSNIQQVAILLLMSITFVFFLVLSK